MTYQLVIGAGEVGRALGAVLDCDVVDVHTEHDFDDEYEILHIAFPWMEDFLEEVTRYQRIHNADVVVVHSTVPVGTCDPMDWIHSPVRGRHPDLEQGIRTFVKPMGGENFDNLARARFAFASEGVEVRIAPNARTTEVGKLLELAQYGAEVRMQKEAYWICREYGVDPEQAYRFHGMEYNDGFEDLGDERFVKPILSEMPGPIGGHCVAPGTGLLDSNFFSEAVYPITEEGWDGRLT